MTEDPTQEVEITELIFRPPQQERMLPWLAALSAAGLPYRLEEDTEGWGIHVQLEHALAVEKELAEYERANQNWPPAALAPETLQQESDVSLLISLLVTAALLLFFRHTGPYDHHIDILQRGSADTAKIIAGQWWRAVTSLTLHADFPHVLGNAVCCFFFGLGASHWVGSGAAWLLILLSGFSGNLAAAYLTGPGRTAVGASTATFGALGLLSFFQVMRNWHRYGNLRSLWSRTWVPFGAGLALLALLGTGPRADLAGHLCGFSAGLVCGFFALPLVNHRVPWWGQTLMLILFATVVYTSWQLA